MNIMLPVTPPLTSLPLPPEPVTPAAAILSAAERLLLHLERGERIDAAALRAAMEDAFGATDATGAWDWKAAYEACEVATVLFLRKYGKALFRKAASPAARLAVLAKITEVMRDRLRAYGLFTEIISWKLRFFVPVDGSGPPVLARLLDTYAIARVAEREVL